MAQKTYRIGDVANLMGLSRDTLRYYEKRGVLSSKKEENGYRYYTEEDIYRLFSILYQRKMDIGLDDLEQIWKILIYKEMGFELGQIKQILALSLNQQKIYLEKKKEEIETRIAELNARTEIVTFVRQNGIPPAPVEHMAGITYVEYIRDMGKVLQ